MSSLSTTRTKGKQDLSTHDFPYLLPSLSHSFGLFLVYNCSLFFPLPFQPATHRLLPLHAQETDTCMLSDLQNSRLAGPSPAPFLETLLHWFPSHHSLRTLSHFPNLSAPRPLCGASSVHPECRVVWSLQPPPTLPGGQHLLSWVQVSLRCHKSPKSIFLV